MAHLEFRAQKVTVGSGGLRPWASPRVRSGWVSLTERERAVARLVADGLTNRAVAARLIVSPHTVNAHLRHVFTKLGVNSRVAMTRIVLTQDVPSTIRG